MNNKTYFQLIPRRWKYLNIIDYLLPIYIVMSVPLFYMGWHYSFVFKFIGIFISIIYLFKFAPLQTKTNNIFNVFILLVTLSIIQYSYNDRPIEGYFGEVSNYVAAMLFYYVGASDDRLGRHFYNRLLYSIVIVFTIGLIFYFLTPSWYVARNLEIINNQSGVEYNEINVLAQMRFSAFFGDSYYVSHLSVFAVAIAVFGVAYKKGKEKVLAYVGLTIGLLSSIACMHRAAILGSAIALILFAYFYLKTQNHLYKFYFGIIVIVLLLAIVIIFAGTGDRMDTLFEMLTNRVDDNMSLGKALDERKFTKELMDDMKFYIFGHGLGSGGVGMRAYGYPGISDMQYVKMFYENGVVGAVLFILIILQTLRKGIKYIRYFLTEDVIILFILLAMLGSNSLSIYYFIVYPFWYAVGRINNSNYLHRLKNKEWK